MVLKDLSNATLQTLFKEIAYGSRRMAIQQIPRTDPEPDPEAVIYNALAETVSVGLLNLEGDALSENEQKEELEVIASHVLTSLFKNGYRFAVSKVG